MLDASVLVYDMSLLFMNILQKSKIDKEKAQKKNQTWKKAKKENKEKAKERKKGKKADRQIVIAQGSQAPPPTQDSLA